jgi:hypothetical protein
VEQARIELQADKERIMELELEKMRIELEARKATQRGFL